MTAKRASGLLAVAGLVAFLALWAAAMWYWGPETIVRAIGVNNGYLLMLFVAVFGGASSIGGPTYIATIATLASGGLDPLILALIAGFGVTLGDTAYFMLGRKGGEHLGEGRITRIAQKFARWLDGRPGWVEWAGIYAYIAFLPLPNDVLTVLLGISQRSYPRVIAALALGNFTKCLLVAVIASQF